MRDSTKAVHVGVGTDSLGAVSFPVYQTAIFQHPELGGSTGFDYSRSGNPTRKVLEKEIAHLENGHSGFAFSSGMSAINAILMMFKAGSHLIINEDLYGGTYRLVDHYVRQNYLQVTYVDTGSLEQVAAAVQDNTRAILVETPSNPLLKIADIKAVAGLSKESGLLLVVDNTFLSPYYQKPIDLGADIVIHSGSKYLGGHNDLVAGVIVTGNEELSERVYHLQNGAGAVLGPQDSWLLMRGMKTLGIRLEKQQQNALAIAQWLEKHPAVNRVYYPGLSSHPGHELNRKQAAGFGGVLSFEVDHPELVKQVLQNTGLILFAESLGGVESLITYPAVQTHADLAEETRERLGVNDRLLRMSVGIEDVYDLIKDLEVGLS